MCFLRPALLSQNSAPLALSKTKYNARVPNNIPLLLERRQHCVTGSFGYTLHRTPTNSLPLWSTFEPPSKDKFPHQGYDKTLRLSLHYSWCPTAVNFQ